MTTEPQIRYFLGANSQHGFYSLYDHLINPVLAESIYILKGGAGCGKSSLMKKVARHMESAGLSVEYIYCSGDLTSLDAIIIPEKRAAIVDGTAPHVVEPKYPGLVEHYVNLERCYDPKGLAPMRTEIMECIDGLKSCYARTYRCLSAAAEIEEDSRAILATPMLEERVAKRAKGIILRELRGKGKGVAPGTVKQRFLSGITHDGIVCFSDTAEVLCKRIYELADNYGLAHIMLTHLLSAAVAGGYDTIACPSPLFPERLEHLLIPELSLAFVSSSNAMPYEKRPARRIRLDAMADGELLRRSKPRIRFSNKVSAALVEEAVSSLHQAKALHDELEMVYNPHVDFGQVYDTADALIAKLLG